MYDNRQYRNVDEWAGVWYPKAGDAVCFEPWAGMRGIYCEVVGVIGRTAVIDVPGGGHPWFDGDAGLYMVDQLHLFPQ